ncbi:MAG: ATP-binding cassette domain-containing protein [Pseudomonadota bacterium]
MSEIVIDAKNIVKEFQISRGLFKRKATLRAIKGVNLSVSRGEVLGLVGESGCGKSTLARILMGIIQPTAGTVTYNGRDVKDVPRVELARLVQPVFQDPYSSLNPAKTLGAIVTQPLRVQRDKDPSTWEARVREMFDLVGLPKRMYHQYPNQLSGGQRQRVAIARALINRPDIVVCDEPTSALDVSVQSQILNLLNELRRELNQTFIIISHNMAVVEHMATRVAVMYFGELVEEAETRKLFRKPEHDYTRKLLNSILMPDPRQSLVRRASVS